MPKIVQQASSNLTASAKSLKYKLSLDIYINVDFIFANSPLVLANRQEPAEYSSKYHENEKCIACSK